MVVFYSCSSTMRLTIIACSRYFKRYIERELTHDTLRRQWKPLIGWKEMVKKTWVYGEHRPWTSEFKRDNTAGDRPRRVYVEPIKEWSMFKGDQVCMSFTLLLIYTISCSKKISNCKNCALLYSQRAFQFRVH